MSVDHALRLRDQHIFTLSGDVGEGEVEYFLQQKSPSHSTEAFKILERETRLELATPTLARLCSTN